MTRSEILTEIQSTFEASLTYVQAELGKEGTPKDILTEIESTLDAALTYVEDELDKENPIPAPSEGEQAVHCDKLVTNCAVNAHINWRGSGNIWTNPQWKTLWKELGARYVRTGMSMNKDALAWWREINAKLIFVTANGVDYNKTEVQNVLNAIASTPDLVEAVEGPNEPNNNNPPNWAQAVKDYQQWLFDAVNAIPALADKRILGPSIWGRETAAYNALGDIGAMCDIGNLHYYTGGRPPPVAGFPSSYDEGGDPDNTYTLDDAIKEARIITPGKNVWITEVGWPINGAGCTNNAGFVTPRAQAKYTLRYLCDAYNRDVYKSCIYTLLDDVHRDPPRYHGLVDGNFAKRPAFTALKNFLAMFNNPPTTGFAPGKLVFTATKPNGVDRLPVMQNTQGKFFLLFWQPMAESYNRKTFTDATIPPINVKIDLGSQRSVRTMLPTFSTAWVNKGQISSLTVPVPDEVLVVEIT